MRLHRFYINTPITEKTFHIADKELVHQWKSVFRYNVGSQVILFDGSGVDYLCIISSLRSLGATLEVVKEMSKIDSNKKINVWLCVALIKKDNFELALQKATEIGVNHIVPVLCDRSEKKSINMERLQKIAVEAVEQSGRGDIPFINEVIELSELLDKDLLPNSAVFLDISGKPLKDIAKDELKEIAIFIGPEGGWTDVEMKNFEKHNIAPVSIGSHTLRAETAAIAISSLLLL